MKSCEWPLRRFEPDFGGVTFFPCGRCSHCRQTQRAYWTTRVMFERMSSDSGVFRTLTYSPEGLSQPGSTGYSVIQNYTDRLRRVVPSMKFFAVQENGEKTGRPHWHVALLGVPLERIDMYDDPLWRFGHVVDIELNASTLAYLMKYLAKQDDPRGGASVDGRAKRAGKSMRLGNWSARWLGADHARLYPVMEKAPSSLKVGGVNWSLPNALRSEFEAGYLGAGGRLRQARFADALEASRKASYFAERLFTKRRHDLRMMRGFEEAFPQYSDAGRVDLIERRALWLRERMRRLVDVGDVEGLSRLAFWQGV